MLDYQVRYQSGLPKRMEDCRNTFVRYLSSKYTYAYSHARKVARDRARMTAFILRKTAQNLPFFELSDSELLKLGCNTSLSHKYSCYKRQSKQTTDQATSTPGNKVHMRDQCINMETLETTKMLEQEYQHLQTQYKSLQTLHSRILYLHSNEIKTLTKRLSEAKSENEQLRRSVDQNSFPINPRLQQPLTIEQLGIGTARTNQPSPEVTAQEVLNNTITETFARNMDRLHKKIHQYQGGGNQIHYGRKRNGRYS